MVNLDLVLKYLEMPENEQSDLADAVCQQLTDGKVTMQELRLLLATLK